MSRKTCTECNGDGHIWNDTPDRNGWGWKETKEVCENCHGEGDEPLTAFDYDGERVRVIATGAIGTCNIFGENTIIVVADNDDEFTIASIAEVELCAS